MRQEKAELLLKGLIEGIQDFYNVLNGQKKTEDVKKECVRGTDVLDLSLEKYLLENVIQMYLDPSYEKHVSKTAHINTFEDMKNKENERVFQEYKKEDKIQENWNKLKRNRINKAFENIVDIIQKLPAHEQRVEHFSNDSAYTAKEQAKKDIVGELGTVVALLNKDRDNASFKVNLNSMYKSIKKLYQRTNMYKKLGFDTTLDDTTLEKKLGSVLNEARTLKLIRPCGKYNGEIKLESVADALLYGADGNVKNSSCVGRYIAVIALAALIGGALLYDKCSDGKHDRETAPTVEKGDIKIPEPPVKVTPPEPKYGSLEVKDGDWTWKMVNREFGVKDYGSVRAIIDHLYNMNKDQFPDLSLDTKVRIDGVTKPGKDGIVTDELKPGMQLKYDKGFVAQFQ